jgi:hypothetical protein
MDSIALVIFRLCVLNLTENKMELVTSALFNNIKILWEKKYTMNIQQLFIKLWNVKHKFYL